MYPNPELDAFLRSQLGPMIECSMGYPTDNPGTINPNECTCNMSCEPHIHEDAEYILCLHDGETDHGHCPQANNPASLQLVGLEQRFTYGKD